MRIKRQPFRMSQCEQVAGFLGSFSNKILITGPRYCTKTYTITNYILDLHERHPGFKSAVVRTERRTLKDTFFKTLYDYVLFYHPKDPRQPFEVVNGLENTEAIKFENGGEMRFFGMDGGKIRGATFDLAFYNEATNETKEENFSNLVASMAGGRAKGWTLKNGKRFWQVIADSNPGDPSHFIMQYGEMSEVEDNGWEWYRFQHRSHPDFYDWDKMDYTEEGQGTIDDLLEIYPPGHLRDRYVYGLCVGAHGQVFSGWNRKKHVIAALPDTRGSHWKVYRGIDFGFDDPFACLWYYHNTENDKLIIAKEYRKSMVGIDEHGEKINTYSRDEPVEWSVADHDPGDAKMLEDMGISTVPAIKDTRHSIHLMQRRIARDGLYYYRDALLEKCAVTIERNNPPSFQEEILRLAFPEVKTGNPTRDDAPVKGNDHSIDPTRYVIERLDGQGTLEPRQPFTTSFGRR